MKTNIDLVNDTDKFPYVDDTSPNTQPEKQGGLYTVLWQDADGQYPIGYMLDRVVEELPQVPLAVRGEIVVNHEDRTLLLFQLPSEEERSRVVAALASYWRGRDTFPLLRSWRNELWPVYGRRGELLFSMERAAMGLLGTMRYGVHMIAYVRDAAAPGGIKLWVPRRAADKATFPGMLDNTVAGGLMTGEDPRECIIREADEEASLPDELVRNRAQCVGTVTYMYITDSKGVGEGGYIYPECQWVYDLELPAHITPMPKDGEVEQFWLRDIDQVREDLAEGKFKPNCALVTLDFFIRHGILTEDDAPNLAAIKQRMHREMPFPGPHQSHWRPSSTG